MSHDDFAFEPIRGLPEKLPPGEALLWQGAPDWRRLARSVFHIGIVAAYFAAMIVWQVVTGIYDGAAFADIAAGAFWLAGLGALCLGILIVLARAMARTTVYSLTNERLVMRIGVALPVTLNIPFSKIDAASCRVNSDGSGDISVTLMKGERISYAVLWPHARPLHINHPQPTLRSVRDASEVAGILSRALALSASDPEKRQQTAPAANVQPLRPAAVSEPASGKVQVARIA